MQNYMYVNPAYYKCRITWNLSTFRNDLSSSRIGSEESILDTQTEISGRNPATFKLERSQSDITFNSVIKAKMLSKLFSTKLKGSFFNPVSQVRLYLFHGALQLIGTLATERLDFWRIYNLVA